MEGVLWGVVVRMAEGCCGAGRLLDAVPVLSPARGLCAKCCWGCREANWKGFLKVAPTRAVCFTFRMEKGRKRTQIRNYPKWIIHHLQ